MDNQELIAKAIKAREESYSPYSGFAVGAALLTRSGRVYTGCNVENASYSATLCAERVALSKAVSAGEREFEAIAIVGCKHQEAEYQFCPPCGMCRQVMYEFCNPREFRIVLFDVTEGVAEYILEELMPMGFGPGNLNKE